MPLDFLGSLQRTHMCGELRAAHAGQRVTLMGWVNRRRDLGQLIFIDVRDRSGLAQIVFDNDSSATAHARAEELRNEYVIAVTGTVKKRDANTINKNIPTGEIEVVAEDIKLLNTSEPLPFSPADTVLPNEEMRLEYRYLDLRRPDMQRNIILRHNVALAIRDFLASQGFLEIETPFMTRSTPEGARDYLVPSRVHAGHFYALPQSPQLFKQILMIGGFDKYFQIVRCFRDEDLRADRQPEFTQIDLEMTFPTQDRVFATVEGFLKAAWKAAGHDLVTPFPRVTYDEAIRQYGIDKPDLRLPAFTDVRPLFTEDMLSTLGLDPGLPVIALRLPNIGELSRKERDDNKLLFTKKQGPRLLDDLKRLEKSWPDLVPKIRGAAKAEEKDLLVIIAGAKLAEGATPKEQRAATQLVYTSGGAFRVDLARKYADRHGAYKQRNNFQWLWVTDFPMFEWSDEDNRFVAAHHPFTSPHEEDMDKLTSDPAAVRSLAYDVVLNGTELGSGSIRIHRQDIQSIIFRSLGMSDEEAQRRFGFFLQALTYGTPPHGGIALGLDRIVMILAGADSLREVIPFPKTAKAIDLMVDAPTVVAKSQLDDLHIEVTETEEEQGKAAGE